MTNVEAYDRAAAVKEEAATEDMNSTPEQPEPRRKPSRKARAEQAVWGFYTDESLALAAQQLQDLLGGLEMTELREKIGADARLYLQFLQVIARFSDARVRYERQRAEEKAEREKRRAERIGKKKPSGIQPETMDLIEHELNLF